MRTLATASAILAITALPATASTLPKVDFEEGKSYLAIGILDANLDYAVSDRLSIGVTGTYLVAPFAARATLQLGKLANGLVYGITLSAGVLNQNDIWFVPGRNPYGLWTQPAFNVSLPFGETNAWTLRGTIGPAFSQSGTILYALPNVELAYRIDRTSEVTLGGNSIAGWRWAL